MENKDLQNLEDENSKSEFETEILRNEELGENDSTVVIDEEDRTVLLTEDETLIIEKEEPISISPKNRPRKVYSGMWGIPEIITVGLASLALLSIFLVYLFFVLPAQNDLEKNRAKRDELEKKLSTADEKYGDITTTETQVAKLIDSATDFETRFLKNETVGKSAIYQRINGLITGLGLTNTTGPDYVPLEISEEEKRGVQNTEGQRGRSKFQSLFPGVYVTMTVEGSYFSLRRFIQEIEKSNEFIVISTIELEPAEDNETENADGANVTKVKSNGKTRGKTVSLRLEMAAYFQRPAEQRAMTVLPRLPEQSDELSEESK